MRYFTCFQIYRPKGLQTTTSATNVGQDVRMKESLTLSANGTVIAHKVENLKVIHDIDRY